MASLKQLQKLAKVIQNGNFDKYIKTVVALHKFDYDDLIILAKHKSSKVRREAIEVLAQLDDERAVVPLVEALEDEEERVRTKAAGAIWLLEHKRAVEPLIKLLTSEYQRSVSNEYTRFNAIQSLGILKDERALAVLDWVSQHDEGVIRGGFRLATAANRAIELIREGQSNLVEEIKAQLLPPLRKWVSEISEKYPNVKARVYYHPMGSYTELKGYGLGIDFIYDAVYNLELEILFGNLYATPKIRTAKVTENCTPLKVEKELYPEPANLTQETLQKLVLQLPELYEAAQKVLARILS